MASCAGVDTNIIGCSGGGDAGVWSIIILVVNIMTGLVGILAMIGIVLFGIQYSTSAGDVGRTTKARRRLIEIIIGLAVYFSLYALMQWLVPGGVFNVEQVPISDISFSINNKNLYVGDSTGVNVTILPENASNKTYSLVSEKESIASISSNNINCVHPGTVTIKVIANDGKTATDTLTCAPKPNESSGGSSGGSSGSSSGSSGSSSSSSGSKPRTDLGNNYLTESQVRNYVFKHEPTYDDIVELFEQYGIKDGSDEAIVILSWVKGEGYWAAGDRYLGYLSACVIVNNILEHQYGPTPLKRTALWGSYYAPAKQKIRADAAKKDIYTLRPLYLALKYLMKGIHCCYGPKTKPAGTVYTGKNNKGEAIYVF